VEVGLPGGYIDFEGNAKHDLPCPAPRSLDYTRWLGPAPEAPYAPARVHKNWRYNLDYGGGLLMDWIGHHMDIAHWGLGLDDSGPVEVAGRGTFPAVCRVWNAPAMYHVEARYAQGYTIVIEGDESIVPRGTKWIGERGWLWVDRAGIDARPRSLLDIKLGSSAVRLPDSSGHHRQFLECVLSRGETLTPPGVALRSATPGYLGLISILTDQTIRWDPLRETIVGGPVASRLLSRPMRAPWRLL
jgi:predicted dehydrogenase